MPKRGISYFSRLFFRYYIKGLPSIILDAAANWSGPREMVQGFRVVDYIPETRSHFTSSIDSALTLIKKSDPIRFQRLQREVHIIVNVPEPFGSSYRRGLKICALDMWCFCDPDDPEMSVRLLASVLIFRSTVGHLLSRGILRTRQNLEQFDLLCCKEPERFLKRIGMSRTPWDPDCLTNHPRMGFWSLATKHLREVMTHDAYAPPENWEKGTKRPEDPK